jgi:hypothetical protein
VMQRRRLQERPPKGEFGGAALLRQLTPGVQGNRSQQLILQLFGLKRASK